MPKRKRKKLESPAAARPEPDRTLLAGRGSLRNRELLGLSPRWGRRGVGEQTERCSPPPDPCPLSGIQLCSAGGGWGGGAGSRGAAPGPPLLIGPWRRQPPGRHAPGPGARADKACQRDTPLAAQKPLWVSPLQQWPEDLLFGASLALPDAISSRRGRLQLSRTSEGEERLS